MSYTSTQKPITIDVYRIDTFSGENNKHGVDRSESWVLKVGF